MLLQSFALMMKAAHAFQKLAGACLTFQKEIIFT
jgi:hypothetical protein